MAQKRPLRIDNLYDLQSKLTRHPFLKNADQSIQNIIVEIITMLWENKDQFEKKMAGFTLAILEDSGKSPKKAAQIDKLFTALDAIIEDFFGPDLLSDQLKMIFVEAMHIHDLGKPWESQLSLIRELCVKILQQPS